MRSTLTSLTLLVAVASSALASVQLTTCGETIPGGTTGVLARDLDCGGGLGVTLLDGARLKLDGHAMRGGVICTGSCMVAGPGDISGASAGIFINGTAVTGTQRIKRVTLHDNIDGIGDQAGELVLSDVVSSNNQARGIFLQAGSLRGRNVTTWNNGTDGVHLSQGTVRLTGFTAVANGAQGLANNSGLDTIVTDSVLKGNAGSGTPLDLFSVAPPRVRHTACDHSLGQSGDWNVCAGD
jgi:hypothetical protein